MGKQEQFRIGEVYPLTTRGAWKAEAITPLWYILKAKPQKDPNARAWLKAQGVEVWYPTETRWRVVPRGKRKKVPYEARIAPGYLFAMFEHRPVWHVLFDQCCFLSAVVCQDGVPLPIPESILSEMQDVPQRLREMHEARAAARIIKPGDKAMVKDGPFEGWQVDVTAISGGVASFLLPLLGMEEAKIPVSRLEKVPKPGVV